MSSLLTVGPAFPALLALTRLAGGLLLLRLART
jgi:hypothetical protein